MVSPVAKQRFRLAVPALIAVLLFGYVLLDTWRRRARQPAVHPYRDAFNPLDHCNSPYDAVIGYAHGIPAFSNCHRLWTTEVRSYAALGDPLDVRRTPISDSVGLFRAMGHCWDAAEFITRFYYFHRGIFFTFNENDYDEYWSGLSFGDPFESQLTYEVVQLPNYAEANTKKERKRQAPRVADIVVWSAQPEQDLPVGHMAVVVDVVDDVKAAGGETRLVELRKKRMQPLLVYIAEQNFDNKGWEGRNYSRVLRFSWRKETEAELLDPDGHFIIGHARPGKAKLEGENENYDL
ncbi:D-alanyl-glycyl endopeptidase-like protein [Trypanosoma grayi]|uniref:D-alanyl-glycyl endopeptidase-like protein n=1 Tax=Trypanosoma grayi TaxID=71804 RepID=UPI0004F45BC4|nr:D-alanyl-glycyl endopeptidase-like protein [Trypanosoma grayi]KEG09381.1 D-alanyl-glycyl endopeptidase-like protein [Trypanosoma grayi]